MAKSTKKETKEIKEVKDTKKDLVELTLQDFSNYPELNVQDVKIGDKVEKDSLFINQRPNYQEWVNETFLSRDSKSEPPSPVPFP